MNDFDLEAKLKSVRVPERPDEYWVDFPSRVRMQLTRSAPGERVHFQGSLRWGWNGGLALACVLLFFLLVPMFHAALKNDRSLRRDAERFSQGMRALMADEHGMQNVVTDSE